METTNKRLPIFRADFSNSHTVKSIIFLAEDFKSATEYLIIMYGERFVSRCLDKLTKL